MAVSAKSVAPTNSASIRSSTTGQNCISRRQVNCDTEDTKLTCNEEKILYRRKSESRSNLLSSETKTLNGGPVASSLQNSCSEIDNVSDENDFSECF